MKNIRLRCRACGTQKSIFAVAANVFRVKLEVWCGQCNSAVGIIKTFAQIQHDAQETLGTIEYEAAPIGQPPPQENRVL